jgi:hypothetical protein
MARVVLRVVGLLLAGAASVETFLAMWFRLDTSGELRMIEQVDLELGAMFALAFVLLFAPTRVKGLRPWLLTAGGAALLWVVVSGSLIWSHQEQCRIRSTLPSQLGEAAPVAASDTKLHNEAEEH